MSARIRSFKICLILTGILLLPDNIVQACGVDHEDEVSVCPEIALVLTPVCALSQTVAQWRVINSNPIDVSFVATVDCADESLVNRIQTFTVAANSELVFETPRTEFGCGFLAPTVSIYVFGHLDATEKIPTNVIDSCGVCGGNDAGKGCDGVCFSGKTTDRCGVCGGDGSTCNEDICTQQGPSDEEIQSSNQTKRYARKVRDRTRKFAKNTKRCDGSDLTRSVIKANALYLQIVSILDQQFTNTVLVCLSSTCTGIETAQTKTELRKISNRLVNVQKRTKIKAINACSRVQSSEQDTRLNTEDYRDLLLGSVSDLADQRLSCSSAS